MRLSYVGFGVGVVVLFGVVTLIVVGSTCAQGVTQEPEVTVAVNTTEEGFVLRHTDGDRIPATTDPEWLYLRVRDGETGQVATRTLLRPEDDRAFGGGDQFVVRNPRVAGEPVDSGDTLSLVWEQQRDVIDTESRCVRVGQRRYQRSWLVTWSIEAR